MFSTLGKLFCRRCSTESDLKNRKSRELKKKFFDQLRIHVKAGAGGQGFPKYGGVGGKGGDVILTCKKKVSLRSLREKNPEKRYTAETGKNSSKHNLLGQNGNSLILEVPVGISVQNDQGRELADLNKEGQEYVVAEGGPGGNPGNSFLGRKGEAKTISLVLKLIADVGLVGFPNAGKSTFLSAISRADPKIANYPFTTLKPQIGTIQYPDLRQITVADLPGLIEGAHVNFGLGHKFLRHVERTKLLLFMVDIFGFQLGHDYKYRTAFETILLLNKELELYKEELLEKPAVLALNKIDEDTDGTMLKNILQKVKNLPDSMYEVPEEIRPEKLVKFDDIFVISAKNKHGTEEMKARLRHLLDIYAEDGSKELALQIRETEKIVERSKEQRNVKLI